MSSEGNARILNYKLYMEGVQLDFIDININVGPNQPSSCTINMIPTNSGHRIRPRTHVHIFYYDDLDEEEEEVRMWKLLWEGEVTGLGYSYSHGSRSLRVDCMDLTNYWDSTVVYSLSSFQELLAVGLTEDSPRSLMELHSGSPDVLNKIDILELAPDGDEISLLIDKFFDNKKENPEGEIGVALELLIKKYKDLLEYVRIHHDRKRVIDKIFTLKDEESKTIANTNIQQLYKKWYEETSREGFRQLLVRLLSSAFYNIVHINSPVFDKETGDIKEFLFKPNVYIGPPPKCNVIFPDEIISLDFSRQFLFEKTRTIIEYEDSGIFGKTTKSQAPSRFYGPRNFRDVLETKGVSKDGKVLPGELMGNGRLTRNPSDITFRLLEEEIEKGVLPREIHIGNPEYYAFGGSKESAAAGADYIGSASRYEARTINIHTEFNPNIVADFPGLVNTRRGSFLFRAVAIGHFISSTGGATTTISGNMTRVVEKEDRFIDEPAVPFNVNKRYLINFADGDNFLAVNKTYSDILGCESIVDENLFKKINSELNEIISNNIESREDFERRIRRRVEGIERLSVQTSILNREKERREESKIMAGVLLGVEGKIIHKAALSIFNSVGEKDVNDEVKKTDYDKSDNKYIFAKNFKRREGIATIEDVFERHYGLQKNSDANISKGVADEYGGINDRGKVFDYVPPETSKYAGVGTSESTISSNRILTSFGHKKEIIRELKEELVQSREGADGR